MLNRTHSTRRLRAALIAAVVLAVAACGSSAASTASPSSWPGGSSPAGTSSSSGSPGSSGAASSGASGPAAPSAVSTGHPVAPTAAAPQPPLGQPVGVFANPSARGFGEVEPTEIYNGGDPTGEVTGLVWSSWGGIQATATGKGEYLAPGQPVAAGTEESVTVVAFDLGSCGGKFMYRSLEWYFPQHGGKFDPHNYEDVCGGGYVGTGNAT